MRFLLLCELCAIILSMYLQLCEAKEEEKRSQRRKEDSLILLYR